jgi:hypothetical protein
MPGPLITPARLAAHARPRRLPEGQRPLSVHHRAESGILCPPTRVAPGPGRANAPSAGGLEEPIIYCHPDPVERRRCVGSRDSGPAAARSARAGGTILTVRAATPGLSATPGRDILALNDGLGQGGSRQFVELAGCITRRRPAPPIRTFSEHGGCSGSRLTNWRKMNGRFTGPTGTA